MKPKKKKFHLRTQNFSNNKMNEWMKEFFFSFNAHKRTLNWMRVRMSFDALLLKQRKKEEKEKNWDCRSVVFVSWGYFIDHSKSEQSRQQQQNIDAFNTNAANIWIKRKRVLNIEPTLHYIASILMCLLPILSFHLIRKQKHKEWTNEWREKKNVKRN